MKKLKDACWKGYEAIGLKKKNGKTVPNCVPKNEAVLQTSGDDSIRDCGTSAAALDKEIRTPNTPASRQLRGILDKNKKQQKRDAMKEQVEQIDELSKDTLVSYHSKAKEDLTKAYDLQKRIANPAKHQELQDKMNKRFTGMRKAFKKVNPDKFSADGSRIKEEVLDEVSKEKLDTYIHKSFEHGNVLHKQIEKETDPLKRAALRRKLNVRNTGVQRAAKRLTTEDISDKAHIEQHLADKDINSKFENDKVHVHHSNVEAAKKHLKRAGYHYDVVGGLNESDAAYAAALEKQKEKKLTKSDQGSLAKVRELMAKEKAKKAVKEELEESYRNPTDSEIDKIKAHVKTNHPDKTLVSAAVHKKSKDLEYVLKDKHGKTSGHTIKEETEEQKKEREALDLKLKQWRSQQRAEKALRGESLEETVLNEKDPHDDYQAKSKALHDLSLTRGVDQKAVQQRKLDLDREYARIKKEEDMSKFVGFNDFKLEEKVGDDVISAKQRMEKTGKMSIKDKLLSIPRGFKAARAGKSEVDANLKKEEAEQIDEANAWDVSARADQLSKLAKMKGGTTNSAGKDTHFKAGMAHHDAVLAHKAAMKKAEQSGDHAAAGDHEEAIERHTKLSKDHSKLSEEVQQVKEGLFDKAPKTKAGWEYTDKKRAERNAEHKKQDPKMHAKHYAQNMVDTEKAAKKAKEHGIKKDARDFDWKVRNGVQRGKLPEEVEQPMSMVEAALSVLDNGVNDFRDTYQLTEGTVHTKKYKWGTMKTVHHGADFSIPLHPEHHKPIAKLKDGQEHHFKDETGKHWGAYRRGSDVHFISADHSGAYKTTVKHSSLHESLNESTELDHHNHMAKAHDEMAVAHEHESTNGGSRNHDYASTDHANAEQAHKHAAEQLKKHGKDSENYKGAAEQAKRLSNHAHESSGMLKFKKTSKPNVHFNESLNEDHVVAVSDGSKYDEEPHHKDVEHVKSGVEKHGGEFDGHSDKGAFFKFKSHSDAENFRKHVNACPHKSCSAEHLDESVQIDEASDSELKHLTFSANAETNYARHDRDSHTRHFIAAKAHEKAADAYRNSRHYNKNEMIHHHDSAAQSHRAAMERIGESVKFEEEFHVVGHNSYYGDKQEPVKLSSHKTKEDAEAALASRKANKERGDRSRWHKIVDSAGLKKHMNEDIEQIDELSKGTLASYAKKAADDTALRARYDNRDQPSPTKKTIKRLLGTKKAIDKLAKEDVEQVDELNKSTLASYVGKASKAAAATHNLAGMHKHAGSTSDKMADKDSHYTIAQKLQAKANKRLANVAKAGNKLAKEDIEQVDELNKSTLASYAKKSHDQLMKHTSTVNFKTGRGDKDAFSYEHDKDNMRKTANRTKGLTQAVDKLAKEEVEQIDELSKVKLVQYINKATQDVHDKALTAGQAKPGESRKFIDNVNKSGKRKVGITKAAVKLAREETDMVSYKDFIELLGEAKIDDLKDRIAARKATQSAYDSDYKPADKDDSKRTVKGKSYGAGKEDDEEDENKKQEPQTKRGRGRPAGSKSGARV